MSDYDRGKYYGKKKFISQKDGSGYGRSFFGGRGAATNSSYSKLEKESAKDAAGDSSAPPKKPMILIKREKDPEDVAYSLKRAKEPDIPAATPSNESHVPPQMKPMTRTIKFLEDNALCTENVHDYFDENNDFLVVGIVGMQGVGKSTILNLLAHDRVTDELKKAIFKNEELKQEEYGITLVVENLEKVKVNEDGNNSTRHEIFKIETVDDIESNSCATKGIDIFKTKNNLVLLDCQPFISVSMLDELLQSENKRSNTVSEFISSENSGEIQGLQLTTFLMSVCHILIVVQDWIFDSNVIRFIQTAEMLKPTHFNPEDEQNDHFPQLLLVHNKAQMEDFTPLKFRKIQQIYAMLFNKSKLGRFSHLGMASKKTINLNDNCEDLFNVFLIPECNPHANTTYLGHPPLEDLIKKMRANIFGAEVTRLTNIRLTEKTWLIYCAKVWETIKKSSFFVEYTKLMP